MTRRVTRLGQEPKLAMSRYRARHNALKSGLYAKTRVLPFEDAKAYAKLRVAIFSEWSPRGAIEEGIVELVIADLWRLNRFIWIENAFVEQTKLALRHRPPHPAPMATLELVQSRNEKNGPSDIGACTECQSGSGRFVELPSEIIGEMALLDAFVCRVSQTPMEDVARQRRCANRELLRNINALESLQATRQAINSVSSERHPHTNIGD